MKNDRLNNSDRAQWIDNVEELYNWWRSSGLSKEKFIQQNRADIDIIINEVLNRKPTRPDLGATGAKGWVF